METTSTHALISDEEMVAALKKRQLSAFDHLYDQYAPAFYGDIKRALYQDEVSEETLEHIFKTIWTSIDEFDPSKERLFAWALKIAKKEISKQKIDIALKDVFGY